MAGYILINKYLHYQQGITIYPLLAGETRQLEFIKSIFASHIIDAYLKDGTFTLFPDTQKQEEPVIQEIVENDIQEPAFEIVYKTTDSIQDKDGNTIQDKNGNAIDIQLTKEELKEKGFTKKKIEALLKEEKLMEIKVVK